MAGKERQFKQIDSDAERIGVLGSPSSTAGVLVDIMGQAVDKRLVGSMTYFSFLQDGKVHCALGQITEIALRNLWVEGPTMRSLIREKGRVDPITGRQDTHTAEMSVGAVFAQNSGAFEQSQLGTIPSTGTNVKRVGDELLDHLLATQSDVIKRIGRFYGNDILFPAWFRHFGEGPRGVGEAYHFGIFGKTGSGKSVLAEVILLGFATNPEMSIFVIDPQGQFYKDFSPGKPARDFLEKSLGREVVIANAKDLWLTTDGSRYRLFFSILSKTTFFSDLGIFSPENQIRASTAMARAVRRPSVDSPGGSPAPWDLWKHEVFDKAWRTIGDEATLRDIYTQTDLRERVAASWASLDPEEMYRLWASVGKLFTKEGKRSPHKLEELAGTALEGNGKFVVIDLSEDAAPSDVLWDETVKLVVLHELVKTLRSDAEKAFREDRLLNALVLLDEAHRFAPRDVDEERAPELAALRQLLIDSVLTTRKYGLGWGFVSQTLHSISRSLSEQFRIYVFGYGLAWGVERRALDEIIGGSEALRLYQSFRDPETSLGEPQFPFMVTGPLSPLSFSGAPLFFTALRWPEEVLAQMAPSLKIG